MIMEFEIFRVYSVIQNILLPLVRKYAQVLEILRFKLDFKVEMTQIQCGVEGEFAPQL